MFDFLAEPFEPEEPVACDPSLKAPFPYFGGKRRAAALIWERFGDVPNFVEFFGGSAAVTLARPADHHPRIETINDIDGLLVNFWRAVRADPEGVAKEADYPVSEIDLHSRHRWLIARRETLAAELERDPFAHDVRAAAWWVWGLSCWIAGGWCTGRNPSKRLPDLCSGHGGAGGAGVHRASLRWSLPAYLGTVASRIRYVRLPSGDWRRVSSPAVTWRHGTTAILIDPPYTDGSVDYATGSRCSVDARAWAIEHGEDQRLRIALCGYEGEHDMPGGWDCVAWKAGGGYGNQRKSGTNDNARRERIWFSPHCLKPGAAAEPPKRRTSRRIQPEQPSLLDAKVA